MHGRLLAEHGGARGIRDSASLSSALARPQQLLAYGDPDIYDLAAAYASGILCNHPFVDGNKRTAFMTTYVFLARNRLRIMASEIEASQFMIAVAADELGETELASWLRDCCDPNEKAREYNRAQSNCF
jgi:death-on-curing protein